MERAPFPLFPLKELAEADDADDAPEAGAEPDAVDFALPETGVVEAGELKGVCRRKGKEDEMIETGDGKGSGLHSGWNRPRARDK